MLYVETRELGEMAREEPGDLGAILRRIDERCKDLGLTQRQAGLRASNPDYVRNMRKQWLAKVQFSAKEEHLKRLVGPLNTTFEWLWRGTGVKDVPRSQKGTKSQLGKDEIRKDRHRALVKARDGSQTTEGQTISGTVQAGSFYETDQIPESFPSIPIDPNYPTESQFVFLVRGHSVNKIANDGDYLIAIKATEIELPSDQLVIVVRIKSGLSETTARKFRLVDDQIELTFDSSDPRYRDQEPLRLPVPKGGRRIKTDDGTAIEIRGMVVSVYRQV